MLIETSLISIVVAFFRKGKLKNLKNINIKGWYLIILAACFQSSLVYFDCNSEFLFQLIVIISYFLLLLGLSFNIRKTSMLLMFIGTFLNYLVIVSNGGYMPVSSYGLGFAGFDLSTLTSLNLDTFHVLTTQSTKLFFLSDIFPIPEPYPFPKMLSIGDLFIMTGLFVLIQNATVKNYNYKNK